MLIGDFLFDFYCGMVKANTLETLAYSSSQMTEPYTLLFFFPMDSAVDQSEIRMLKASKV